MNAKYSKNPDIAWRTIEGQAVLVHNRLGEIQVLNAVGTYAWEHWEEGLESLAASIAADYQLSLEAARQDLEEFTRQMLQNNLLLASGGQLQEAQRLQPTSGGAEGER